MAAKTELKAKLSLNTAGFQAGIRNATAAANKFAASASRMTGTAVNGGLKAMGAIAVTGGLALAYQTKKAFELGEQLNHMSMRSGIAVDKLMVMGEMAKDAGLQTEDLTGAISKMQRNLIDAVRTGVGPTSQALDLLGENAMALAKSDPDEAFRKLGDDISKIKNPALQASAAIGIFGKEGAKLLPLFKGGGYGEMAQIVGKQAGILKQNAQLFDDVSNRLSRSGIKMQGFAVGFAGAIAPQLNDVLKKFDTLDLSDKGKAFGLSLVDAATKFSDKMEGTMEHLKDIAAGIGAVGKAGAGVLDWTATVGRAAGTIEERTEEFFKELFSRVKSGVSITAIAREAAHNIAARNQNKVDMARNVEGASASSSAVEQGDYKAGVQSTFWKSAAPGTSPLGFGFGIDPSGGAMGHGVNPFGRGIDKDAMEQARFKALKDKYGEDALAAHPELLNHAQDLDSFLHGAGGQNARLPHSTALSSVPLGSTAIQGSSGGLGSNGGLNAGAYAKTDIFSHRERMAMEDARVAAGGTREATNPRAYNSVRRGDAARAKNLAKDEARKALTLEGTNARLDKLIGQFDKAWLQGGGSDK